MGFGGIKKALILFGVNELNLYEYRFGSLGLLN